MSEEKTTEELKEIKPSLKGSCRLTICLVASFVYFAAAAQTNNLPMAIVCINQESKVRNESKNSSCAVNLELNASNGIFEDATEVKRAIYFDKPAQGILLGAVYYGIVPVQILVGWISDKYGINRLQMCLGSFFLSIATFVTPAVLEFGGFPYYLALRIFKGVVLSFAVSSIVPLLTGWTTAMEQGFMMGISTAGLNVANSVTFPISGLLCQYCGWKSVFFFGGTCGILSFLLAAYFVYDSPAKHPRIGDKEKQFLLTNKLQRKPLTNSRVIPWSKMLLCVPVWAVVVTNFFFSAVTRGTILFLPILVRDVLDFTVTENGIFSALPLVGALLIHVIAGPLFDYARTRYPSLAITTVRKFFHVIGTVAPASLMFACSQLTPDYKYYIISMITIGFSLNEFAYMAGFGFAIVEMAPDFVGVLLGLQKSIGLAAGFIIPSVIAALTPNGTVEEWSHVFHLYWCLYVTSCLIYVIFGSSKLQKWNETAKDTVVKEAIA